MLRPRPGAGSARARRRVAGQRSASVTRSRRPLKRALASTVTVKTCLQNTEFGGFYLRRDAKSEAGSSRWFPSQTPARTPWGRQDLHRSQTVSGSDLGALRLRPNSHATPQICRQAGDLGPLRFRLLHTKTQPSNTEIQTIVSPSHRFRPDLKSAAVRPHRCGRTSTPRRGRESQTS